MRTPNVSFPAHALRAGTAISRFPKAAARASTQSSALPQERKAVAWLERFLWVRVACQIALLFETLAPARIVFRIGVFGTSLLLLLFLPRVQAMRERHPAMTPALFIIGIMGLMWFHPTTNSPLSGAAQGLMYLAIIGPLFWASRLDISPKRLENAIQILWGFHTVSSVFGILQVYFPGRFQPALSTVIGGKGEGYVESLQITLDSGERVFRPMGLSDVPGGAATAGFYAILFGSGFFLLAKTSTRRALCLGGMVTGLACIYLSQVRVALVVVIICLVALGFALSVAGKVQGFFKLFAGLSVVAIAAFTLSTSVAEESVTKRLSTLTAGDPRAIYQQNRGIFMEHTVTELLPQYPLGAGLGRWGMMNGYFGDNTDLNRAPIWVEIQWTGWLLDGGVPLIIAYAGAVLVAIWMAFQVARSNLGGDVTFWAAVLFAHGIGMLALTFSFPIFISQSGLEFWLFNAALFTAARQQRLAALPKRPPLQQRPLIPLLAKPR